MLDVCVLITTFERPDLLLDLLHDLDREARGPLCLSVRVYDDASGADYGEVRGYLRERGWVYVRADQGHGRARYREWMSRVFQDLRGVDARFYLKLDDDLRLCRDFLPRLLEAWERIPDPDKASLNPLRDRSRVDQPCWTRQAPVPMGHVDRTGWVDGIFLCQRRLFEVIDFRVPPVPDWWSNRPDRGSGFGWAVSHALLDAGLNLYRVGRSLLAHRATPSVMNAHLGAREGMAAADFIDGEEAHRRLIFPAPVTASLASIPSREQALADTVTSLLPQVDRLNVYLNEYDGVPGFLKHPKIEVGRSQTTGNLFCDAKFFWAHELEGYHITCDDDLIYPPDYALTLLHHVEALHRKAACAVHGARLLMPFSGYHETRRVVHFRHDIERLEPVHTVGSGVFAYHTDGFEVTRRDFVERPARGPADHNMTDIVLGVMAQRQQVPLAVIPHRADWIRHADIDVNDTIWAHSKRGTGSVMDSGALQTRVIRAHMPWKLRYLDEDRQVQEEPEGEVRCEADPPPRPSPRPYARSGFRYSFKPRSTD
jgi:hypothetical protein